MENSLNIIKEQLFDAPSEVKEAFNTVVEYFDMDSTLKGINPQDLKEDDKVIVDKYYKKSKNSSDNKYGFEQVGYEWTKDPHRSNGVEYKVKSIEPKNDRFIVKLEEIAEARGKSGLYHPKLRIICDKEGRTTPASLESTKGIYTMYIISRKS